MHFVPKAAEGDGLLLEGDGGVLGVALVAEGGGVHRLREEVLQTTDDLCHQVGFCLLIEGCCHLLGGVGEESICAEPSQERTLSIASPLIRGLFPEKVRCASSGLMNNIFNIMLNNMKRANSRMEQAVDLAAFIVLNIKSCIKYRVHRTDPSFWCKLVSHTCLVGRLPFLQIDGCQSSLLALRPSRI